MLDPAADVGHIKIRALSGLIPADANNSTEGSGNRRQGRQNQADVKEYLRLTRVSKTSEPLENGQAQRGRHVVRVDRAELFLNSKKRSKERVTDENMGFDENE